MKHKVKIMKNLRNIIYLLIPSIFIILVSPGFSQSDMQISATSLVPGKVAAYKFVFTTEVEITVVTEIDITFPADFDLRNLTLVNCNVLDGRLSMIVKENIVHLKRIGGQNPVPVGTDCEVILAAVLNPNNILQSQHFGLSFSVEGKILHSKIFDKHIDQIPAVNK